MTKFQICSQTYGNLEMLDMEGRETQSEETVMEHNGFN